MILLFVALFIVGVSAVFGLANSTKLKAHKNFSYLRWIVGLLSIVIFLSLVALIFNVSYNLLGYAGLFEPGQTLFSVHKFSFSSMLTLPPLERPVTLALDLLSDLVTLGILFCLRAFMKNLLDDLIFTAKNVQLARLATYFLVLASISADPGQGAQTSIAGSYIFFNLNYLLLAVLVWTLSLVLEKAIVIAEENKFTI